MTDPDITLTDFALAALCAGFAISLAGDGAIGWLFAGLFAALALASLTGALWHGWFPGQQVGLGGAFWLGTMAAVGFANLALWLIAGEIFAGGRFAGPIRWIAGAQLVVYLLIAIFRTRSFLFVSKNSLPPTLALAAAYGWGLANGGAAELGLGLAGIGIALLGAVLQMRRLGLPAFRLSPNALYHLLQALAFTLLYASIPALGMLTGA